MGTIPFMDFVVPDSNSVDPGGGFRPDNILNWGFRSRLEVHVYI